MHSCARFHPVCSCVCGLSLCQLGACAAAATAGAEHAADAISDKLGSRYTSNKLTTQMHSTSGRHLLLTNCRCCHSQTAHTVPNSGFFEAVGLIYRSISYNMLLRIAAAITACRGSDKVQVNAVRALGNLFAIEYPPLGQHREAQLKGTRVLSSSSQQAAACAATANLQSTNTPEGDAFSCGQVQCSCGGASCSISGHTYWWGEEWLSQGIQCLLLSLGSSTDKVWLSK